VELTVTLQAQESFWVPADKLKAQEGTMLLLRVGMFGVVSWNYCCFFVLVFWCLVHQRTSASILPQLIATLFFIMSSATRSPWDSWPLSDAVAAAGGDVLAKR